MSYVCSARCLRYAVTEIIPGILIRRYARFPFVTRTNKILLLFQAGYFTHLDDTDN